MSGDRKSGSKEKDKVLNPVTPKDKYEFGGPVGALATMLGLPVAIYALSTLCAPNYCLSTSNADEALGRLRAGIWKLWDPTALGVTLAWLAFHVLLERILPYSSCQGVVLRNGKRLSYRISGHLQFWVSLVCVAALQAFSPYSLIYIYDNFLQLAFASVIVSVVLSVFLYAKSFQSGALLALGGNTGNPIYDFFIGRELNPRIGNFDLKEFCELRPGLIGWAVINFAMALKQYELHGHVTAPMALVIGFQTLYVLDGLKSESAILTTMDITSDGFGFMLAFGDLAWVPFTYTIQARYLVDHDPALSPYVLAAIAALNVFGYIVFRGSNSQKDAFRTDPKAEAVRHLKSITTKSGTRLLISGYWGWARKINYTGDWLMGLAWCLYCGFHHPLPYWYAVYFFILLVHRALRDDHACHLKYGDDWKTYKKHVRSLFIPGVI